jgi:hypothetical protein
MSLELKPVVIAKEGVAKIGNDIINLADRSVNVFKTNDLTAFIGFLLLFLSNQIGKIAKEWSIFYDLTTLMLKETKGYKGQEPVATCHLKTHPILNLITTAIKGSLTLERLDEFLFILRPYYAGTEATELYERLQKFSVKKLESIVREKDRQGNYVYACTIKDEPGSPDFPASINFCCPLFENIEEHKIFINLELFIDYKKDEDGEPSILFTLKNPLINMQIERRGREIIEEYLSKVTLVDKFFGSLDTIEKSDSWKYQINKI